MSRRSKRSGPVIIRVQAIQSREDARSGNSRAFPEEISYTLSAPFVNDNDARIMRELVYLNSGKRKRASSQLIRRKQARYGLIADPGDLSPNFFERLLMKGEDRHFIHACLLVLQGKPRKAYEELLPIRKLADVYFLSGMLALKLGLEQRAGEQLSLAMELPEDLGHLFQKYHVSVMFDLPVTATVMAHVGPTLNGTLLALVEAKQRMRHSNDVIYALRLLQRNLPGDIVVLASLCEYLLESAAKDPAPLQEIVALTDGVANDTYIHATVMLYRAQAYRRLGELDRAREVLTVALRKSLDRTAAILIALRLERFELFMQMDEARRAVDDLRKLRDLDPALASKLEKRYQVSYED